MSLQCTGWGRMVHLNLHDVRPVRLNERDRFSLIDDSKPLLWKKNNDRLGRVKGGLMAYGQLQAVSLNGNFLVKFEMDINEIRSLLKGFIKSDPVTALELLSEMQIEAIKPLLRRNKRE